MGLIDLPSPVDRVTKPEPWDVRPSRVASEWQWAWEGLVFSLPVWRMGGAPQDVVRGVEASSYQLSGDSGWGDGRLGTAMIGVNDGSDQGFEYPYPVESGWSGITMVFVATRTGSVGLNTNVFGNANGTPTYTLQMGGSENINFRCTVDGSEPTVDDVDVPLDTPVAIIGRWGSGHPAEIQIRQIGGGLLGSDASSPATGTTDEPGLSSLGFMDNIVGTMWEGPVYSGSVYDRRWLDAEIEQYTRDPFGWIRPQQQIIVRVPSAEEPTFQPAWASDVNRVIQPGGGLL